MADVYTRIGYIKGATGATGAQGAKGDQGDAATIQVGTVTTVAYGQTANVVNSGTSGAAVFDFTIPQGKPGEQTTDMQNLTLGSITASSASFPVPSVGETGKVLWGKVVKWFSDMSALVATKLNAANVVNNLTTTASGYALDARQGKTLNDYISTIRQGSVERINLTSIYGDGWASNINIDIINNMYGYIYRIRDDLETFSGTSPRSVIGGNAFLLIGFSEVRNSTTLMYGVQLAIGMGSAKVAIRNATYAQAGATWSAWAQV